MRLNQIIKSVAATALFGLAAATSGVAHAADADAYPKQAIRIIDAFPAGGSTDFLARQIATYTGEEWGVPMVVENRGGAAGQIGTGTVARSAADGYTFLVIPNELWTVAPVLYQGRLTYDTHKQLTPLAPVAQVPIVLAVNPKLPVSNLQELIAYAKQHPDLLTYGSAGVGSIHHLAGQFFATKAGVSMMHVPYQGTAPAVNDLLGGQISMVFSPITSVLQHVRAGSLKALAVTGETRAAALPDVPTAKEAGVAGYQTTFRVSLLAPAGVPQDISTKWFEQVKKVISSEKVSAALGVQGVEPDVIAYDAWIKRLDQEAAQWREVIDQANIRVE